MRSNLRTLSLALAASATMAARIDKLPGWSGTNSFYGGYVTVDPSHARQLYYFFAEADTDAGNKPLVLWLNGGPGCSSVGGGLMSELGPFFPDTKGDTLQPNPWSWTQQANMLFLESPAGVGFSYSNVTTDYTTGDQRTTADAYTFLQGFLQEFPQYRTRAFYISGESYGGHYVPLLAQYIAAQNEQAPAEKHINLQGFLVGNAWTDAYYDNYGTANSWWARNIISDDTYAGLVRTCNFSIVGPLLDADAATVTALNLGGDAVEGRRAVGLRRLLQAGAVGGSGTCDDYQAAADREMGSINIYAIYADVGQCTGGVQRQGDVLRAALGRPVRTHRPLRSGSNTPAGADATYDPCIDEAVARYLNRPDVQQALHANPNLGYAWTVCSSLVNYSRRDLLSSVIPVYRDLIARGVRMLVYSGDQDGIVATTGTRWWMNTLNMTVAEPWRPFAVDGEVGGYVARYEQGITFATVRGAGHMVPYTQKSRALHMFTNFLASKPL